MEEKLVKILFIEPKLLKPLNSFILRLSKRAFKTTFGFRRFHKLELVMLQKVFHVSDLTRLE